MEQLKDFFQELRGPWSRRHIAMAVLCVVLALVLATMLVATAWVDSMLDRLNRVDPDQNPTLSPEQMESIFNATDASDATDSTFTGPTLNAGDITWADDVTQQIGGENTGLINILIIGQDRRPGEYRARSDAMLLCTFDTNRKVLTMTSFLRDLYVQIPGYKSHKLNTAYQAGGMSLLNETLYDNFGIHVDGNVEVDFSAFAKIINILGGVQIRLTSAEASYLNSNYGWNLAPGMCKLSGEHALAYSRIRAIGMDFERSQRQRNVLAAVVNQCKSMSLAQFQSIVNEVLPLITTDLGNNDILAYVMDLFPMLSGMSVSSQRVPADNAYQFANIDGLEVLLPDLEACRQQLLDSLMPRQ